MMLPKLEQAFSQFSNILRPNVEPVAQQISSMAKKTTICGAVI